ncbi:MAG TPA: glycosyltransferase [Terracidiphilus sp.]|nr:glycosyltransferase [Terracidiphilus sp.]
MNIFVFGSSITSSYWNGAATYYRGCYKYLSRLGHNVVFAEPDAYGRQQHRDAGDFSFVESVIYEPGTGVEAMLRRASRADVVIKHSGLGVDDDLLEQRVLECADRSVVCFWDVDAPATIQRLETNPYDPFHSAIPKYDAVLTYGGGLAIQDAYRHLGAQAYFSIYNAVDVETHHPVAPDHELACDVAFIGNRLPDREARVEQLFLKAAELAPQKQFLLGGEGWEGKPMPRNVRWIGHVPTAMHNVVNCSAGMVMNINRTSMAEYGYAPPTRVFEAAGAGACLLCDEWPGIDRFFEPGREILVIRTAEDVAGAQNEYAGEKCRRIGNAFRDRALRDHTYARRAGEIQSALLECLRKKQAQPAIVSANATAMSGDLA